MCKLKSSHLRIYVLTYAYSHVYTDSHSYLLYLLQSELYHACNITIQQSSCTEDVIYTFESLRAASVLTNPYCLEVAHGHLNVFCQALNICNNGIDLFHVKVALCQGVRQKICTAEWSILEFNNRSEELIDCSMFGETYYPNCTEQFDLANNGSVCLPLCREFSQHGKTLTDAVVALNAFCHLVNILGGIIVFIAFVWNRSKM